MWWFSPLLWLWRELALHHRSITPRSKKWKSRMLANGLSLDYGPPETRVPVGPWVLLLLSSLSFPETYVWYEYRIMVQPLIPSGLDWKLGRTDTGKVLAGMTTDQQPKIDGMSPNKQALFKNHNVKASMLLELIIHVSVLWTCSKSSMNE